MILSRSSTISLPRFVVLPVIVEFSELDTCSPRTVGPEISSPHVEGLMEVERDDTASMR